MRSVSARGSTAGRPRRATADAQAQRVRRDRVRDGDWDVPSRLSRAGAHMFAHTFARKRHCCERLRATWQDGEIVMDHATK